MAKSKLVDGCIPAYTKCPYQAECGDYARNFCVHTGKDHPCIYSCAMARSFEITVKK